MLVTDLTMNMIEFFDDASDLEGRQIPQSTASNSGIAATDGQGGLFRDLQDLEGAWANPPERAAAIGLFSQGRDDASRFDLHVEIILSASDDFRQVQGLLGFS